MKSITIVMTYHNRPQQLFFALRSIRMFADPAIDIIIIDDGSNKPEWKAEHIANQFHTLNIQVVYIPEGEKTWTNPCIPYNRGLKLATGNIIMIQNAEVIHMSNTFKYVREHLTFDNYISMSCYSTGQGQHIEFERLRCVPQETLLSSIWNICQPFEDKCWYNHPVLLPVGYHFCSAITRENYERIGGFNEIFAKGYCFDDNEFVWRIRQNGLVVEIPHPNFGYVIHQWHEKNPALRGGCPLWEKNRLLFNDIVKGKIK